MKIVIDIDGTLTDARHREALMPADVTNTLQWVAYNSASRLDAPRENMLQVVRLLWDAESTWVTLLTSRGDAAEFETREWLRFHQVCHDRLIMRAMNDHRPSLEYKRAWFTSLKPDVVIDDCPEICAMAREMGITVLQIDSLDPFVMRGNVK